MTERFKRVMIHQQGLMAQFREIEIANGLSLPTTPVQLDGYAAQAELRRLAWCIQEELCEAAEQFDGILADDEMRKEMIDALHFIAEMMLTCGYWPDDLPLEDPRNPDHVWHGPIPNLFQTMVDLGLLINLLKNKPWKQVPRKTDEEKFKRQMAKFIRSFFRSCYAMGLDDDGIERVYFGKAAVNQERIDTGV